MDQVLHFYNTYVIPYLTTHKRESRISISAAIGLLTLYWTYDKVFRPPRQIRGIPQAPFFGILKAMFTSKPIDDLARITLPIATQSPSGLYTVRYHMNTMSHILIYPSLAIWSEWMECAYHTTRSCQEVPTQDWYRRIPWYIMEERAHDGFC